VEQEVIMNKGSTSQFCSFMEILETALQDSKLDEEEKEYLGLALFDELYSHPMFAESPQNIWYGVDQGTES
jgi:hypothetical protein